MKSTASQIEYSVLTSYKWLNNLTSQGEQYIFLILIFFNQYQ